jgi:hypothetical protein
LILEPDDQIVIRELITAQVERKHMVAYRASGELEDAATIDPCDPEALDAVRTLGGEVEEMDALSREAQGAGQREPGTLDRAAPERELLDAKKAELDRPTL